MYLLNEELRRRMTIDYGMEHLWLLTSAVYAIGGASLDTPRYISITHPELDDHRSANEIKNSVLEKIDKITGIKSREGG